MDPFSALSISTAAVQFIDFACKIVCKTKELANSMNGVTYEIRDTETVTTRLRDLTKDLRDRIPPVRNEGHERLLLICNDCEHVSRTLCERITSIRISSGHSSRKWTSFRQALKCVWNKSDLDSMAQRLASLRMELDTQTLVLLSNGVENLSLHSEANATSISNKADMAVDQLVQALQSTQDEIVQHINTMDNRSRDLLENLTRVVIDQGNAQNDIHAEAYRRLVSSIKEFNAGWGDRRRMSEAESKDQRMQYQTQREALVTDDLVKTKQKVEVAILESLRFPEMGLRFETVPEAHRNTFKWIFRDPSSHGQVWDDFADWLSNGRGVYWICGKAASGKSSLMRFLVQEQTTSTLLEKWSKGTKLEIPKFFFWNSGTEDQRSQLGLFRTLAFDVLDKRRDLIPQAFPTDWERQSELIAHDIAPASVTWSLERVVRGFKKSLSIACQKQSFCLFIDGIDEYGGEPSDAAEIINELAEISPNVKICVSSRPLAEFQSIFSPYSSLRLQDLTKDDIRTYVSDKFNNDRSLRQALTHGSPDAIEISEYIVLTASGVFFWVVLVVKTLLKGARNGDSVAQLKAYLFSLPKDMEMLFEHMLAKVECQYREDGARIFQLFRAGGYRLDVLTLYWALLHDDAESTMQMPVETDRVILESGYNQIIHQMKLRVSSRTFGLLEVHESSTALFTPHTYPSREMPNIQYIHRTARDYLERPDVWDKIVTQTKQNQFNPLRAHLQGAISFLKATSHSRMSLLGIDILRHISNISAPVPNEGVLLLEEIERLLLLRSFSRRFGVGYYWKGQAPGKSRTLGHKPQNLCEVSLWCGITWYAIAKMNAECHSIDMPQPGIGVSAVKTSQASGEKPPLLLFAMRLDHTIPSYVSWSVNNNILETILRHGGDPNGYFRGHTLWEYTISWVHIKSGHLISEEGCTEVFTKTFTLMLEHGADPNACCIRCEQVTDPTRTASAERSYDMKLFHEHVPIATSHGEHVRRHNVTGVVKDWLRRSNDTNRDQWSAVLNLVERRSVRWSKKRPREEHEPEIIEIERNSPNVPEPSAGYDSNQFKKRTREGIYRDSERLRILDETSGDQHSQGGMGGVNSEISDAQMAATMLLSLSDSSHGITRSAQTVR